MVVFGIPSRTWTIPSSAELIRKYLPERTTTTMRAGKYIIQWGIHSFFFRSTWTKKGNATGDLFWRIFGRL